MQRALSLPDHNNIHSHSLKIDRGLREWHGTDWYWMQGLRERFLPRSRNRPEMYGMSDR